jgi:hypothetical protein
MITSGPGVILRTLFYGGAPRDLYIFTRAATPNSLCVCIGGALAKTLLPFSEALAGKMFRRISLQRRRAVI